MGTQLCCCPGAPQNPPCCSPELSPCVTTPRPSHRHRCDSEVTEVTRAPADHDGNGRVTPSLGHLGATSRPGRPSGRSHAGGHKDSGGVAASRGARQPQVVPGEAAGEEGLVAALFLPPGTAGDTAPRDTHGEREGTDVCPRSEPWGGGHVPPPVPTRPQEQRRSQHSPALPTWTPPGATAATLQLPARPGDACSPLPSPEARCDTPLCPTGAAGAQAGSARAGRTLAPRWGKVPMPNPAVRGSRMGLARAGVPLARLWWPQSLSRIPPPTPGRHSWSPQGHLGGCGTRGTSWEPPIHPQQLRSPQGATTPFPAPQTRSQGNSFPPQPIPTQRSSPLDPVPSLGSPTHPGACAWHERFPLPASPSRPAFLQPLVFHKTNTPGELPSWARQLCR